MIFVIIPRTLKFIGFLEQRWRIARSHDSRLLISCEYTGYFTFFH